MKLAATILAAGYSSRMDGFKPLLALAGRSLLEHAVTSFRLAGIDDIRVVTGHRHDEVETEAARFRLTCHHNPHYDRGMYGSVCAAAEQLSGTGIDGFFLLPVDIPLVRPATIVALAGAFDGRTVVYPTFEGLAGHPPLIPAHLLPVILTYDGQGGLKALLEKQPRRELAVWDRNILIDADKPEDFATLGKRLERLNIGDPAEALALAALAMPERGVAHGRAVAHVATTLGRELNRLGYRLDLDLLHNGGLLHDVAKGSPRHEARGGELLAGLGLGGLAAIVSAHRDACPPAEGSLTEKELVSLADKLVRGIMRVSVARRYAEKLDRYREDEEACRAIRRRLGSALALQTMVEEALDRTVEAILGPEDKP